MKGESQKLVYGSIMRASVGIGRVVECASVIPRRAEISEDPPIRDPTVATATFTPE